MEIINRRQRMQSVIRKIRRDHDKTIGFVPTMGALHEGHLSLVKEARKMCDIVVVSIFVNPTQFGPTEDLNKYPRNLTGDTALLTEYNVDYIFVPTVEEIYPSGFATYIEVEGITDKLEGESRPGHFRGVATVVTILFNIIHPDFAFFGQKDAQQTVVVKRLTQDLGLETEIVVLPTIREENGLALSSRNQYLNAEERQAASIIYRALKSARAEFKNGERNSDRLIDAVRTTLGQEPRIKIDYISVNDTETLEAVEKIGDNPVFVSLAVYFGKTRLIDNFILNRNKNTGPLSQLPQ
jgi:pantoate--beta-alanine ligase